MIASLQALRTHRNLVRHLVVRDLKLRYHGSVAGYLWTLLEPLSLVLAYYVVFTVVAGWRTPRYFLVVVLGVLPYSFLSGLIQTTSRALVVNAPVIRNVYVPRATFVFARAATQLSTFVLTLAAICPLLLYYQVRPGARVVATILATLLLLVFGAGVGLAASCIAVLFRDLEYAIAALLRVGIYLVPVVYTLDRIPAAWRELYLANPVAVYIYLFRYGVLDGPFELLARHVLVAAAIALAVFAAGALVFERWESQAVKHL